MNLTAARDLGIERSILGREGPEDILVTHLHVAAIGGWNSKFR
jgi:hypothetical protein